MIFKKTYKSYVIDNAIKLCPFKKKSKFSFEYYYDMFIIVLQNVNSWNSLKVTSNYNGKSKYHYTTIRKMFNKWSKYDIFKIAYYEMLKDNNLNGIPNNDLFIDACFINNKTGTELVGINPMYYKKRVTKLSVICTIDKVPLSVVPFKSTTNDCTTIVDSLKEFKLKRKTNLIADKGYVSTKINKNIFLKHHKVKLITPKKKNQKNVRTSKLMRSKLKIRNIVENCIQLIKSYDRIMIRKDKKISNFMGFVFMGIGLKIYNKYR